MSSVANTPQYAAPTTGRNTLWLRRDGPMTRELARARFDAIPSQLPERLAPDAVLDAICGFCSTGCNLRIHTHGGRAVNLTPDPSYPVNQGMACPKGWEALAPLTAPNRALHPLLRQPGRAHLERTSWPEAITTLCSRFRDIQQRHGPDSIAWLGTGQILNEELALLGAVAKFGMGIRHGDGNTRQCMATAVTAYKQSFGFDAPPYTYADFEASDVIVLVGSNLCIAHPILWQRVLQNPGRPEILVVDPRRTETAEAATQHLALRPRSDLVLLYGLAHLLIQQERIDRAFVDAHTTGFEEFAAFVRAYTPDRVGAETGLTVGQIIRAADTIARGKAVSFWWTMGVNQGHQATRTAQAIINLALMTGNMGRPGTGANSITGQCNAMGSRLFSNTTNLLGGHDFTNPRHRERIASSLDIAASLIPDQNSWAYDQIIEGIERGVIRGLWMVATNGAHSWTDQSRMRRALGQLEFLVVQDMFHTTETAQLAHLVLPAAGWGEKTGTFINSERRIGLVQKASAPPGECLSDFNIFRLVAEAWGCGHLFREWTTPESVFRILQKCSEGQPCDITGIRGYPHLAAEGGIQWPFPASGTANSSPGSERRLFADGQFFHADGRARFYFEPAAALPEPTCENYPFVLLTGRGTSAQWHTQSRTAKSDILRRLAPTGVYVEIHPLDAERLAIPDRSRVCVSSRRGEMLATAFVTNSVPLGSIFAPLHYPEVNRLTLQVVDPYSRQPNYKHCAVALAPASAPRTPRA